jgi:nucleoside-diphosphate-sugar epimerase
VFNFISSWFVYGESESLPVSETAHCNPKGFYSITKKCAEDLLVSWCRTFNKKYRIIRLANVYGAGDGDVSKKKNALQYLAEKIKNNENIELYHVGNFVSDYIHVQDAVSAIRLILEKGGLNQTYNVGSGIPHIFSDLIKSMVHITESKSKITSIEPPDFHKVVQVKDMFLDIKKLKNLGFLPTVTIHEGLLEICQN